MEEMHFLDLGGFRAPNLTTLTDVKKFLNCRHINEVKYFAFGYISVLDLEFTVALAYPGRRMLLGSLIFGVFFAPASDSVLVPCSRRK